MYCNYGWKLTNLHQYCLSIEMQSEKLKVTNLGFQFSRYELNDTVTWLHSSCNVLRNCKFCHHDRGGHAPPYNSCNQDRLRIKGSTWLSCSIVIHSPSLGEVTRLITASFLWNILRFFDNKLQNNSSQKWCVSRLIVFQLLLDCSLF